MVHEITQEFVSILLSILSSQKQSVWKKLNQSERDILIQYIDGFECIKNNIKLTLPLKFKVEIKSISELYFVLTQIQGNFRANSALWKVINQNVLKPFISMLPEQLRIMEGLIRMLKFKLNQSVACSHSLDQRLGEFSESYDQLRAAYEKSSNQLKNKNSQLAHKLDMSQTRILMLERGDFRGKFRRQAQLNRELKAEIATLKEENVNLKLSLKSKTQTQTKKTEPIVHSTPIHIQNHNYGPKISPKIQMEPQILQAIPISHPVQIAKSIVQYSQLYLTLNTLLELRLKDYKQREKSQWKFLGRKRLSTFKRESLENVMADLHSLKPAQADAVTLNELFKVFHHKTQKLQSSGTVFKSYLLEINQVFEDHNLGGVQ